MQKKRLCRFAVVCCLALLFGGCARGRDGTSLASRVSEVPEPSEASAAEILYGPGCEDLFAVIHLNGLSELADLRELVSSAEFADGEAAAAYLQRLGDERIVREDLRSCVEVLDALPYLPVLEGEITSIEYCPREVFVAVRVEAADGDAAELFYEPDRRDPAEDPSWEGMRFLVPFTCCDGRVTVYREERKEGFKAWHAVADGICLKVLYYTDEPDRISAEDVFGSLTVVRLAAE